MLHVMNAQLLLAVAALFFALSTAHTWTEQLQVIADNGSYVGDCGYPRAYFPRTSPGFNDGTMTYLIPQLTTNRVKIDNTDLVCHPKQRNPGQTDGYPKLQVAPGSYVALKYIENGHVTNPGDQKGKLKAGGTVFVYGTTQPKGDEKLVDVLAWTADGKGGDGRGRLLTAQNYDDGRCYQLDGRSKISADRQKADPPIGNGGGIWCETDSHMPADLQVGNQYTLYWVWSWPTAAGAETVYPNGKDEYYTTCNDVDVVAGPIGGASTHSLPQQDGNTLAVAGYKLRTADNPSLGKDASAPGSGSAPSSQPAPSAPPSKPTAPAPIFFDPGASQPAVESALPTSSPAAALSATGMVSSPAPSSSSAAMQSAPTGLTSTYTTFQTVTATLPVMMKVVTETAVVTTYVPASTPAAAMKRDVVASVDDEHLRRHKMKGKRSAKFALLH